ncbi:MAG: tyrosine-type recombinase/integrase [Thermoleophilia bacterium]|nr:tyrosine-type recombinase/integrase [Thermoleophilia bacterium]
MDTPHHASRNAIGPESRELLAEFVAQADMAATTIAKYDAQLREFARWLQHPRSRLIGDDDPRALAAATPRDVARFLAYLRSTDRYAATWTITRRSPLSASARKSHVASLRAFYGYLLRVRVIDNDPTFGIKTPKVRPAPGLRLTREELERLLTAPGTARERIQTFLLVFTAARAGALRDLRWDDIDFPGRTLVLRTKNGKHHSVGIHPRLMSELRRWYVHQSHTATKNPDLAAALDDPATAFVLLSRTGRQLAPGAIAKQLKRRANTAGLYVLDSAHGEKRSLVSPHAIRRSIATELLNDGVPLDAVADLLAHEHVDTTRRHYAFANDTRRRATIDAILRHDAAA